MEITCNIIRDILPLYAESVVSEDTGRMVERHLCDCESCAGELRSIRAQLMDPAERQKVKQQELDTFLRLRRSIVLRRVLTVLAAVLTVLALVISWNVYWSGRVYLSAEEAVASVEQTDDGGIQVHFKIAGSYGLEVYQEETYYALIIYVRRNDLGRVTDSDGCYYFSKTIDGVSGEEIDLWYIDPADGTLGVLLWDGAGSDSDQVLNPGERFRSGSKDFLAILFLSCLGLCALLGGIAALTKHCRIGWLPLMLSGGAGSMVLSEFVFTGGHFMTVGGIPWIWFVQMCLLAALWFSAFLACWRLFVLVRRDRAA